MRPLILFLSLVVFGLPAFVTADNELDVFNGSIYSIANDGQYLYVGGNFQRYSVPTGGWVGISNGEESPAGQWPRINGRVYKTISDGSGGFYVGGLFDAVGNNSQIKNLAHIFADGTLDSEFNPNPNSLVFDMIKDGNILYLGGGFGTIDGVSNQYGLASVDATTGILTSWRPKISGGYFAVMAMAIGTNAGVKRLYVGGGFDRAGNDGDSPVPNHKNMAAYVLTEGVDPAIDPDFIPFFNDTISALYYETSSSRLFVGGKFSQFSYSATTYSPRAGLARVNSITGSDTSFNAQITGSGADVIAIASNGAGRLYLGGDFTSVAGTARASVAAISTSDASLQGWNPGVGSSVNALAYSSGNVFLGGTFTGVSATVQNYLARVDDTSGTVQSWDPGPFGYVDDIFLDSNGDAFVGGFFSGMSSDTSIRNLAKVDLSTGHVVAGWNPLPNQYVNDLLVDGDRLFLTGQFNTMNGLSRNYLAALNKNTGALIDSSLFGATLDQRGSSLALDAGTLYVGGDFTNVNYSGSDTPRTGIAALDAETGALNSSLNPNLIGGGVKKIYLDGEYIYLGGDFDHVGASSRNRLARFRKSDGVLTNFDPQITGTSVYALLASGSRLFIGGDFTQVGGSFFENLVAVDVNDGTLDSSWTPNPESQVRAFYSLAGKLYVGGAFRSISGQGSEKYIGLAAYDLSDLSFDTGFDAGLDYGVYSLSGYQNKIWAGGDFLHVGVNDHPYRGIALVKSSFGNITVPSVPVGILSPGNQLESSDSGVWDAVPPVSFSKSWQRCNGLGQSCQTVAGAAGDFYNLSSADLGTTIKVRVSAIGQNGSADADSAATAMIGGTPTPTVTPTQTAVPTQTIMPTATPTRLPEDLVAPLVRAKKSAGKAGKKATLKYNVSDLSSMSSETIKVYFGKKAVLGKKTPITAIPASGLRSVLISAKKLSNKNYSFCVVAVDPAGNQSKKSCARLLIK